MYIHQQSFVVKNMKLNYSINVISAFGIDFGAKTENARVQNTIHIYILIGNVLLLGSCCC